MSPYTCYLCPPSIHPFQGEGRVGFGRGISRGPGGVPGPLSISPLSARLLVRVRFPERCLSRCQTCDGHPERRTRNIIQADLVAEPDPPRLAAGLTADADLHPGPGPA